MSHIAAQLVILGGERYYAREKGDGLDIPGLFMEVMALKGSVLQLMLLAALAAVIYLGMRTAIIAV